jgi:hypothetical protein
MGIRRDGLLARLIAATGLVIVLAVAPAGPAGLAVAPAAPPVVRDCCGSAVGQAAPALVQNCCHADCPNGTGCKSGACTACVCYYDGTDAVCCCQMYGMWIMIEQPCG